MIIVVTSATAHRKTTSVHVLLTLALVGLCMSFQISGIRYLLFALTGQMINVTFDEKWTMYTDYVRTCNEDL